MAFWSWSKVAANNATADASINLAEGMSPSSVNDSARAMMARLAEERDDFSGLLSTGGTATVFTVATNQGLNTPTPTDGQMIAVTMSATNGSAPTLAADGGTAYPIQSSPGIAVASGTLVQGSPYVLMFSVANSAWMLRNFFSNPFTIPLGAMLPYTGDTAPNSNFVLPFGQAISRTTYAAYFAMVSTRFGAGDGTTTFNVPDLRERTVFGSGAMGGGADPGRISSAYFGANPTVIGSAGGADNRTVGQANLPNVTLATAIASGQGNHNHTINTSPDIGNGGGPPNQGWRTGGTPTTNTADATLPAMSGTTPLGGSGTPLAVISPGIILGFILRIQ